MVLRLEAAVDDEVELELAERLPGKADRLAMPVGVDVAPVAARERPLERALERNRKVRRD
jgi:hypothetical protein